MTPLPGSLHQWLVMRLAAALDRAVEHGRAGFTYPGGGALALDVAAPFDAPDAGA